MKITVSVELDDGTKLEVPMKVDSSSSGNYWSRGFKRGVDDAAEIVGQMIEAVYGTADREGIHLISRG
jgi:hypothetical protein